MEGTGQRCTVNRSCASLRGTHKATGISNETQRYANHRASALDPLHDVSPDGDIIPDGPGRVSNSLGTNPGVWLHGTLVLAERRSGYVIILLGSLLGWSSLIRMIGRCGVAGTSPSPRASLCVDAGSRLGVTALFSVILRRVDCGPCNGPGPVVQRRTSKAAGRAVIGADRVCRRPDRQQSPVWRERSPYKQPLRPMQRPSYRCQANLRR